MYYHEHPVEEFATVLACRCMLDLSKICLVVNEVGQHTKNRSRVFREISSGYLSSSCVVKLQPYYYAY